MAISFIYGGENQMNCQEMVCPFIVSFYSRLVNIHKFAKNEILSQSMNKNSGCAITDIWLAQQVVVNFYR